MRWEELNIEISLSFVFSLYFKLHDFPEDFPSRFQWYQQGEICVSKDLQDTDSTFSRDFGKFLADKNPHFVHPCLNPSFDVFQANPKFQPGLLIPQNPFYFYGILNHGIPGLPPELGLCQLHYPRAKSFSQLIYSHSGGSSGGRWRGGDTGI